MYGGMNANDIFNRDLAEAKKKYGQLEAIRLASLEELVKMLDAAREKRDWWTMQEVLTRIINA